MHLATAILLVGKVLGIQELHETLYRVETYITFSSSAAEVLCLSSRTLVMTSLSWAHVRLAATGTSSYPPAGNCSPYSGKLPSFVSFWGREREGWFTTELGVEGGVATMVEVEGTACFIFFFTFLGGSSLLGVSPALDLLEALPRFIAAHGLDALYLEY